MTTSKFLHEAESVLLVKEYTGTETETNEDEEYLLE
jgi:hypothetical protein